MTSFLRSSLFIPFLIGLWLCNPSHSFGCWNAKPVATHADDGLHRCSRAVRLVGRTQVKTNQPLPSPRPSEIKLLARRKSNDEVRQKNTPCILRSFGSFCLVVCFSLALPTGAFASDATGLQVGARYWTIQKEGQVREKIAANAALIDYAVGTVNTMYYDHTAGVGFQPREFFSAWRTWQRDQNERHANHPERHPLASRDGAVQSLHWLIRDALGDPYSKYLTREELRAELAPSGSDGFLGLGCIVEAPTPNAASVLGPPQLQQQRNYNFPGKVRSFVSASAKESSAWMTTEEVQTLPVITAVAPYSPAERAGLTVGDRIVAVGKDFFSTTDSKSVENKLKTKYNAENYLGTTSLTVAKPLYAYSVDKNNRDVRVDEASVILASNDVKESEAFVAPKDVLRAYRRTRVRLPTTVASEDPFRRLALASELDSAPRVSGGDTIVHYELLSGSIFDRISNDLPADTEPGKVGYIRLSRFSRASTAGFINAVAALESNGASSYIIDLRNNYGGVIQEAMLAASALLRDPHSVLCYTMNSRGGFTPHDVAEYVVDKRYPGYLLSRESAEVVRNQVKRENPHYFDKHGWSPMSSFASLHEQHVKRGIHRQSSSDLFLVRGSMGLSDITLSAERLKYLQQLVAQKNLVLLINEGTASSAEVFASALHDNGRTVALVGSKTYGKGLVQHTFPLPDGGGLRLTVAEYLTPALQHVTHVGSAQFDKHTGEWVGGGILPDIACDSRQGIPSNIGADLCVGVALDALEEADSMFHASGELSVKRIGGVDDGSMVRRAVIMGVVKDDF